MLILKWRALRVRKEEVDGEGSGQTCMQLSFADRHSDEFQLLCWLNDISSLMVCLQLKSGRITSTLLIYIQWISDLIHTSNKN